MTPEAAQEFVEKHGVVLASARGPVPNLVEALVGEPVTGSWWVQPRGREIFRILNAVAAAPDVLVCRLVGGKRTFVHRRLWPSLVRAADRFPAERLSRIEEIHTTTGHHEVRPVPLAEWVPAAIRVEAARLAEADALAALGDWAVR